MHLNYQYSLAGANIFLNIRQDQAVHETEYSTFRHDN